MTKNYLKSKRTQAGFTLLFAVLVSTLIVSIGATIISIALRQTILSGTNRESNYAFYAANTILECAVYWDKVGVEGDAGAVFPAPGGDVNVNVGEAITIDAETLVSSTDDITCAGVNIVAGDPSPTLGSGNSPVPAWGDIFTNIDGSKERTFYTRIKVLNPSSVDSEEPFNHEYCAEATVIKSKPSQKTALITTRIEAKGYNTCDTTNPRRVERGIVQQYES